MQPSEWKALESHERLGLIQNLETLRALEKLEFARLMSTVFASKEDRMQYFLALVEVAYEGNDDARAQWIEALTRKA